MITDANGITDAQAAKLRRLINARIRAEIDLSWKGANDPADYPIIERAAKQAKEKLDRLIRSLQSGAV